MITYITNAMLRANLLLYFFSLVVNMCGKLHSSIKLSCKYTNILLLQPVILRVVYNYKVALTSGSSDFPRRVPNNIVAVNPSNYCI